MPLLIYCVTDLAAEIATPDKGLQGAALETINVSSLRCFVSIHASAAFSATAAKELALDFHRVLHGIFLQTTIIPFRFPTILANRVELLEFLQEHDGEYRAALERLKDKVQMEIHLTRTQTPETSSKSQETGTSYLRKKQLEASGLAKVAAEFQSETRGCTESWNQRQIPSGIRCFALIRRDAMDRFRQALKMIQVPAAYGMRITGPWPATEFLDAKQ